ncbi:MAG TPA: lysylphosphatidylglycerol synthase transmembrane domain-containing protein [Vicinamibacterales bacterium]
MKRPSLGTLLRILVAVALTGLLLWKAHPGRVWEASVHADLTCIGIAVALTFLDRALMAYRWLVLLRPLASASHVSLGPVMRIFFVSTFVGTFLPASVGGDAVRAYSLARHDVAASDAVASVFMDRMMGALSVLMLGAVGLVFARDLATHPAVLTALGVALVICAGTAVVVFSRSMADLARSLLRVVPSPAIRRAGDSLLGAVQSYARSHRELLNVLVCSLGVQVLRVVQAYYLGRALGIDAPLSVYFAFIPLILLVMLLPVTVNGIGTSQAAFVWLFSRVGVPDPQAFALSMLFVALGVVGNLPGALLYIRSGLDPAGAAAGNEALRG